MAAHMEKSEQVMIQAFLHLLQEKPMDKITVSDISDTAKVSRNTFYKHFGSVYELKDQLLSSIEADLTLKMGISNKAVGETDIVDAVQYVITYLDANRETLKIFFDTDVGRKVLLNIINSAVTNWRIQSGVHASDKQGNIAIIVSVHAMAGLFYQWLYGHLKISQEELMAAVLKSITVGQ